MDITKTSEDFLEGRVELEEIVPVVEKDVYQKTAEILSFYLENYTSFPRILDCGYNLENSKYQFVVEGRIYIQYLDINDLVLMLGTGLLSAEDKLNSDEIIGIYSKVYDETLPF